jgi:triacylglycerol lipase
MKMHGIPSAVRALGNAFNLEQITATRALYLPGVLGPADVDAIVSRDLQYGPDARHRLDIFSPRRATGCPVVLFVHGGGFVQGDKGNAGDPFFNNVGAWAVRSGFIGVTMTYRLAPLHPWPAGAEDVRRAMEWLSTNIAAHGGDAQHIVPVGHSAGGAHVAGYLAGHGGGAGRHAAAAVFLSGIFALQTYAEPYEYQVYFGSDRRMDEERSTVTALADLPIPSLFTISEFDPPPFHRNLSAVFAARVAAQQRCPEVLWQRNHNHVSVVMQLGSDVDSLGAPLAEFIRQRDARG